MASPLTSVTKVALAEMIREHTTPSKFGYFISEEGMTELIESLTNFVTTSRSVKAAGDRLLSEVQKQASESTARRKPSPHGRLPGSKNP